MKKNNDTLLYALWVLLVLLFVWKGYYSYAISLGYYYAAFLMYKYIRPDSPYFSILCYGAIALGAGLLVWFCLPFQWVPVLISALGIYFAVRILLKKKRSS